MRHARKYEAKPKGNFAKRIVAALAAIAMVGGMGYATTSSALAEDADTTPTNTTVIQHDDQTAGQADDQAAAQVDSVQPTAEGDESGSQLLKETFKNTDFAESGSWSMSGSACLTARSGSCTSTQDSDDIQGQDGNGYLQLTDNSASKSSAVLYNQPVISKNGLHVTFDYYMYHKTSVGSYGDPADGISFFLTDGAATLQQAGAAGAGLGYATNDEDGTGSAQRLEGVAQGVLGIGLDRFGNFSTQNASGNNNRVTGGDDCGQWNNPTGSNSVTVRGKGVADNGKWTKGYCIVASTKVNSGLDTGTATNSADDANGKRVDIVIAPLADANATTQHLTVKIAGTTVLEQDIDRLPDSVKFGFSGSTGADHQVQLIRGLDVHSITKLSQLDLVKSVNKDTYPDADTHVFKVEDTVPYTFVVRNSGNTQLNNVAVNDPNITNVKCGASILAPGAQTQCSGSLTITEDLVNENGVFTNTATATANDTDGNTVTSPQAQATIHVNKPLGAPEKHKRIKKNNDGTYTVNVDVKGAANSTTVTTTQPIDFTLVLDVSGSMDEKMGSGDQTKLTALKNAVSQFLEGAAEANKGFQSGSEPVRVGLVKFAGKEAETVGDEMYQESGSSYNYSQIVSKLTSDTNGLKAKVNDLKAGGATRADYGFQYASTVMKDARSNAKKVVIFFTDGNPTERYNEFKDRVAADAVTAAARLKQTSTVYAVGVVDGANPSDTTQKDINKFLNAVSSNYPYATAQYQSARPGSPLGSTSFNLGTGSNAGYYKAATNASELNTIFDEIQKSETTTSAYTNVVMEDTLSEYVDLADNNYNVVAKDASGKSVSLTKDDYTLEYDSTTKKFTVSFRKPLANDVTYTLEYNVKPTQKAYDDYASNLKDDKDGYNGVRGDKDTDLDGNTTSSDQSGFRSNTSACLAYTADGVDHACDVNPYPHPVIQVVSSTLHIEKLWSGEGDKPENITVDVKQGDSTYRKVTLKPDDKGHWSTDLVIPAGVGKTYTVTETEPDNHQWNASYQHKVGDENLAKGNQVTVPESTESQTATVVITNQQVLVTLPENSISVTKQVIGSTQARDFSFTMTATGDNAKNVIWQKQGQTSSTVTIKGVTSEEEKTASFDDALTFPARKAKYTFQVTEDKPQDTTGWKYDNSTKTVTVTVEYDEQQKKWVATANPSNVTFTNHYIAVSALPLTGGMTGRQWLLIGGGIGGLAVLLIGAAGIWNNKKRLV